MKFTPNIHIDAVRASYKLKHNDIMKQIHECEDLEEKRKLQKKEARLNARTKRFLSKHAVYYTAKRKWHFDNMEKSGLFGDAPSFNGQVEDDR